MPAAPSPWAVLAAAASAADAAGICISMASALLEAVSGSTSQSTAAAAAAVAAAVAPERDASSATRSSTPQQLTTFTERPSMEARAAADATWERGCVPLDRKSCSDSRSVTSPCDVVMEKRSRKGSL